MKKNRRAWIHRVIVLFAITLWTNCAPEMRVYSSSDLALHGQKTVAVLPFDNLTDDEDAARQIQDIFLVEFLSLRKFAVVDPGEVERILAERRIRLAAELSRDEIQQVGKELNASLLVQGSILEYGIRQVQGFQVVEIPYISMVVKIVDSVSGEILWASSYSRNGNDTETVFGFGRITSLNRLTEVMAHEIGKSLDEVFEKRMEL